MSEEQPNFDDVQQLLNSLFNAGDDNVANAPHADFWRNKTRDEFVAIGTDDWGIPGNLVVPGNPDASVLYQALAGLTPFDGSTLPRMPDTAADPGARYATDEELGFLAAWIQADAP